MKVPYTMRNYTPDQLHVIAKRGQGIPSDWPQNAPTPPPEPVVYIPYTPDNPLPEWWNHVSNNKKRSNK